MSAPPPVKGKKVIVIIGAGLSSVALVKALRRGDSTISKIIILEAKDDIGGTWNHKQCYHNLQTHGVRAGFSLLPWDRFDSPYDHAHHKDVHGAMKNLFRKENVVVVEGAQHQNFGQNSNGNEEEKEEEKSNAEKNMTTEKRVEVTVYLSTRVKSMEMVQTTSSSSSRVKLNVLCTKFSEADKDEEERALFADFVIYTGTTH